MPAGIVAVDIDPATGARFSPTIVDELLGDLLGNKATRMTEHFYQEFPPPETPAANSGAKPAAPAEPETAFPGEPL
jgi:penicillin-binding protein 1A